MQKLHIALQILLVTHCFQDPTAPINPRAQQTDYKQKFISTQGGNKDSGTIQTDADQKMHRFDSAANGNSIVTQQQTKCSDWPDQHIPMPNPDPPSGEGSCQDNCGFPVIGDQGIVCWCDSDHCDGAANKLKNKLRKWSKKNVKDEMSCCSDQWSQCPDQPPTPHPPYKGECSPQMIVTDGVCECYCPADSDTFEDGMAIDSTFKFKDTETQDNQQVDAWTYTHKKFTIHDVFSYYISSKDHTTRVKQTDFTQSVLFKVVGKLTVDQTNYKVGKVDPSLFKVDFTQCSKQQGGGKCADCSPFNSSLKKMQYGIK